MDAPRRVLRLVALPVWNASERRPRALIRIALQLAVMIGVSAIQLVFRDAEDAAREEPRLFYALGGLYVAWMGLVAGTVWLGARLFDRRPFAGLGLRLDRGFAVDLLFGFALGAGLMSAILLCETSLGWARVSLASPTVGDGFSRWALLPVAFLVFVAVAVVEELVSRGYQLTNLAEGLDGRWLGSAGAVVGAVMLSSVAFGAAHIPNPHASAVSTGNIILAGVMLAAGYVTTGRLAIPLGLHLSWNFFQNLYGMPVSGQSRFFFGALLRRELTGPEWITGGRFGPEAGMTGLVAIVVGTLLLLAFVRLRQGELRIAPSLTAHPDALRARWARLRAEAEASTVESSLPPDGSSPLEPSAPDASPRDEG